MTKILILGTNGHVARNTTRVLLRDTDAQLTLYLRRASRLENPDPKRVAIHEGDVLDVAALTVRTSCTRTSPAIRSDRRKPSSVRSSPSL